MRLSLASLLLSLFVFGCSDAPPDESEGWQPGDPGKHPSAKKQLELEGARVHYLECGPADGELVLLLHGGVYRGSTWIGIDTPSQLADAGYRAIAPDLPSFGASPESPIPREEFLARFLDELGVESCTLVTPSMSGAFALPFAAAHPERVNGLLALAPVSIATWARELAPDMKALLVWGSEDDTVPVTDADILLDVLPNAGFEELQDAGHPSYLDQPERFHELLIAFLAE